MLYIIPCPKQWIPFELGNHLTLFSGVKSNGHKPAMNKIMQIKKHMTPRHLVLLLFTIVTIIFFHSPIKDLISVSFHSELYSHILLIPVISGYFFYLRRREVASGAKYSYVVGTALLSIGSILYLFGNNQGMRLDNNDFLSLAIFSALVFWTGGLVFSYGARVFRVATFPVLFLLLMITVPGAVIEPVIL